MCFCVDLHDLAHTSHTHVLADVMQDTGSRLESSLPWDLAFFVVPQNTFEKISGKTPITPQFWTYALRRLGPNGFIVL